LRDINVLCWLFCFLLVLLPEGLGIKASIRSGLFRQVPDISFVYFYSMGRMFNAYPAAKVYDYELQKKVSMEVRPDAKGYGPNPYSPLIGILFRPFARMSFFAAVLLWLSISFLLYLAGLFLFTGRFIRGDPLRRSLIFCFALAYWPFMHFLTTGQIAMIGFFALALAFREDDRERLFLSGLALSICLYKPTLLLLLLPMLLITRRYKTLLGFAAGALAQAILITAVEGPTVWPGYFHLLLSFGSAAATRAQHAFTIYSTSYVDLVSFFSILPGGHSWLGRALLLACVGCAAWALVRIWWNARHAGKPANTLLWAATLTWTLVLNTYVGLWDSTPIVLSLIATAAVLKQFPNSALGRWFTSLWVLILACSYLTTTVADHAGIQILTILFATLGTLQLAALRRPCIRGSEAQRAFETRPIPALP
jgi:hypothetical protein